MHVIGAYYTLFHLTVKYDEFLTNICNVLDAVLKTTLQALIHLLLKMTVRQACYLWVTEEETEAQRESENTPQFIYQINSRAGYQFRQLGC